MARMTRREQELTVDLARLLTLLLEIYPYVYLEAAGPARARLEEELERAVAGDDYAERREIEYRERHGCPDLVES